LKTLFLLFFTSFLLPFLAQPISSPMHPGPTPTPTPVPVNIYISDVPFTSQAPFGNWKDPRQQDGCEEAASLIAVYWGRGLTFTKQQALDQILAIAAYEKTTYGQYTDTSAPDTVARIIKGYFNYKNAQAVNISSLADLIAPLNQGQLVIVPTNGRLLGNPNYTAPGPERHNLVIRGYNYLTHEFIANDPGTRKGENYRYSEAILFNAIRDYPTGDHLPITQLSKTAILISR
jgi:hypothetical protein